MIITLLEGVLLLAGLAVLWYAQSCYRESMTEMAALRARGENGVLKLVVENEIRRDLWLCGIAVLSIGWASFLLLTETDLGLVAVSAKILMLIILSGAVWVTSRDIAIRRRILTALREKELRHGDKRS